MFFMDKSPLISLKCYEEKTQTSMTKPNTKKTQATTPPLTLNLKAV